MRVTELKFLNHYLFKNMRINFLDSDGKPLDLIVLAGVNGTGKSTLLSEIINIFRFTMNSTVSESSTYDKRTQSVVYKKTTTISDIITGLELSVSFSDEEMRSFSKAEFTNGFGVSGASIFSINIENAVKKNPNDPYLSQKIIYSPYETQYNKYIPQQDDYQYTFNFINTVDAQTVENISKFYMTLLDRYVYSNTKLTIEESLKAFSEEFNSILKPLNMPTKFVGRYKASRLPAFRNKPGGIFDINGLSSGEKQIFCRYMAFKMFEPNNALMLIDEPENSLHPAWQQQIVKLYQNLGYNNQIIIATQSPHVIASAPKESLRFLELTEDSENPIKVSKWSDIDMTNGMPAERVLKDLMGLNTTRNPMIYSELKRMWERVKNDNILDPKFISDFDALSKKLGPYDEDIMLMKVQMNIRKNGLKHAQSK